MRLKTKEDKKKKNGARIVQVLSPAKPNDASGFSSFLLLRRSRVITRQFARCINQALRREVGYVKVFAMDGNGVER